jgi:hypothetical protein
MLAVRQLPDHPACRRPVYRHANSLEGGWPQPPLCRRIGEAGQAEHIVGVQASACLILDNTFTNTGCDTRPIFIRANTAI